MCRRWIRALTIVKQRAVSATTHAKHLRAYINDDRALLRDVQNIARREAWFKEMDDARECAGHNRASRRGAKNTLMYHQVIAFLPEECDCNGGKLTPELCMKYAREYAQARYPNQQIAFTLHREHCKADGIDRYAVHMAINSTDTVTLRRLDEGRAAVAKRKRAATVRELDAKWGLQQVEEGKINSRIHNQQPRGVEKEMIERGKRPYKTSLRDTCNRVLRGARSMDEYRSLLDAEGITTRIRSGKLYATDRAHAKYEFSLPRLDARLNTNLLNAVFARNDGDPIAKRMNAMLDAVIAKGTEYEKQIAGARAEYIAAAKERYTEYAGRVKAMHGKPLASIPTFKLPRPPKEVRDDAEVQRQVLAYARRAENLRRSMAGDTVKKKRGGTSTSRTQTQQRGGVQRTRVQEVERGADRNGER